MTDARDRESKRETKGRQSAAERCQRACTQRAQSAAAAGVNPTHPILICSLGSRALAHTHRLRPERRAASRSPACGIGLCGRRRRKNIRVGKFERRPGMHACEAVRGSARSVGWSKDPSYSDACPISAEALRWRACGGQTDRRTGGRTLHALPIPNFQALPIDCGGWLCRI